MPRPFEGLLGNNCELRLIEFLFGMEGVKFTLSSLTQWSGVSRPTVTSVVKKFVEFGLMRETRETQSSKRVSYELNPDSPFLSLFEDLNNLLTERLIGDESLYQVHELWQEHQQRQM